MAVTTEKETGVGAQFIAPACNLAASSDNAPDAHLALNTCFESEIQACTQSTSILIRSYETEDYPIVLALWEEAKLRPYREHELERLIGSGGGALVAVVPQTENTGGGSGEQAGELRSGQVVGVILWSHNGSVGILWRLAVAEHERGRGIATKLLDRAEQDIYEAGLSGVTLLTRVTNTVAKSMYTKRGYKHNSPLEFWGKKLPEPGTETPNAENSQRHGQEQTSC